MLKAFVPCVDPAISEISFSRFPERKGCQKELKFQLSLINESRASSPLTDLAPLAMNPNLIKD